MGRVVSIPHGPPRSSCSAIVGVVSCSVGVRSHVDAPIEFVSLYSDKVGDPHLWTDGLLEILGTVGQSVPSCRESVITWAYSTVAKAGLLSSIDQTFVGDTASFVSFSHAFADGHSMGIPELLMVAAFPVDVLRSSTSVIAVRVSAFVGIA